MVKKILSTLALILLLAPVIIWAVTETGSGSNVLVTVSPQDPKAGDFVTVSLDGYGFDKDQSFFDWNKDGKRVLSGAGRNTYSFQLGRLGVNTKITVTISTNTQILAEKTLYFQPTDIDFIWQANTFVPPLYRGKEMATAGAAIKIVASPYIVNNSGQLEKDSNLNFSWQQNGVSLGNSSGLGKNTLLVTPEPNQSQIKISLSASTVDKKNSASKSLIINLDKPRIAFYEIRPLSGVNYLKQIVDSFELYNEEASFLAIPYFWPKNQLNGTNYNWSINGLSIANQSDPGVLTVRQPAGGSGQNEIGLQIKDRQGRQSSIDGRLNIKFGNNLLKFNNVN